MIKDSLEDWDAAEEIAKIWVINFINTYNLKLDVDGSMAPQLVETPPPAGTVLLLRHYDLTGKICPKRFVDVPKEWKEFISEIAEEVVCI